MFVVTLALATGLLGSLLHISLLCRFKPSRADVLDAIELGVGLMMIVAFCLGLGGYLRTLS